MNPEVSTLVAEAVKEIAVYIAIAVIGFIGTVLLSHFKMKSDVAKVLTSVNGIGVKLRGIENKVDEYRIEEITRNSKIREEMAYLKGKDEAIRQTSNNRKEI